MNENVKTRNFVFKLRARIIKTIGEELISNDNVAVVEIENRIIDFQKMSMVRYKKLSIFKRIDKLDSPFAQALVASFIRYYNRIGYSDIDSDLIINAL